MYENVPIEPQDDDVIEPQNQTSMPSLYKLQALRTRLEGAIFKEGTGAEQLHCRYLSPASGGWQKGVLRVRLEFEFVPEAEE